MLKIKDSVDLKELEKFGIYNSKSGFSYACADGVVLFYIDKSRILWLASDDTWINVPTIIFDLIQARLVEKVGK